MSVREQINQTGKAQLKTIGNLYNDYDLNLKADQNNNEDRMDTVEE